MAMEQLEFLIEQILKKQDQQDEKLEKILVQTTKTNGRVDSLKEFQDWAETNIQNVVATLNETKGRDKFIAAVLGAGGAIVGILIGWYLTKL